MSQLDRDGYGDEAPACTGKLRFEPHRRDQATKLAQSMGRRCGVKLVSYRCPHCDGWHVGRRMKDPKALALKRQRASLTGPLQTSEASHGGEHSPRQQEA